MMDAVLQQTLYGSGLFSWLDVHFARFIDRISGVGSPEVPLAAALVSRSRRAGHICLDLTSAGSGGISAVLEAAGVTLPPARDWADRLLASPAVGRPGETTPLVLDPHLRLYLHRYWEYQSVIADDILRRTTFSVPEVDERRLAEGIARLFPPSMTEESFDLSRMSEETDWQKVAAFTAVSRNFSVISGGPGTGKTSTVAKILALLLEQDAGTRCRIALAAPTGKAAARLREAVIREKARLASPCASRIPEEVSTLHRLLGSRHGSPSFRYNAKNPLPFDVVAVDEASMVDAALMAKLIRAVLPEARLILLGDRDQLASVEAGAVLGDICDTGSAHRFSTAHCRAVRDTTGEDIDCTSHHAPHRIDQPDAAPALADSIVLLRRSYRFGGASGIGRVSREINAGNGQNALAVMTSGECPDVRWRTLPPASELVAAVRGLVIRGFSAYLAHLDDPATAFAAFDRFRILAALRQGPFGVIRLNAAAETILREENLIRPRAAWYAGRPVMVTRNDYHLRLFNGDIGIALKDPAGGLRVCFPDAKERFRFLSPLRLPAHETVYAMTVHKSQGSEFGDVVLILPDRDSPVVTRELLYTGITRAVGSVEIWGSAPLLIQAAGRPIQRTSGLRDALWKHASP